jgi:hypothetical protein
MSDKYISKLDVRVSREEDSINVASDYGYHVNTIYWASNFEGRVTDDKGVNTGPHVSFSSRGNSYEEAMANLIAIAAGQGFIFY